MRRSFSCKVTQRHLLTFSMSDKVYGAGSVALAKSQLDWSCACKAKACGSDSVHWVNTARKGV